MKSDPENIRRLFPILEREVNGRPLVYFDNAATTQKPNAVIDAEAAYYRSLNSNVHRGVHYLSTQATIAYEQARNTIRQFINASSDKEVVFTRGTTESINLVASSFCSLLPEGSNIIVSQLEHHSNIVPWQLACQRYHLQLRVASLTPEGIIDIQHLQSLIDSRTALVSVAYISNVLGSVNPVREIISMAHQAGAAVLIDGAQSVAHLPTDVQELDCDFFVFSAHKMYGPMGIGVLYGKEKWLSQMPPYQGGGEMISHVSFEETTYNEAPFKFEAGTPNVAGALALQEAIHFIQQCEIGAIHDHEAELTRYAYDLLSNIDGVQIYGPRHDRSSVISFLMKGIHPFDAGTILDKTGVAIRTGTHCAEPLMKYLGIQGTMRISFAAYNTKNEIDRLAQGLDIVKSMFE